MKDNSRKIGIGIQDFKKLREGGYIFVDKTAKEALEQIEEKGYADRYAADPRHIIKIGANFDSEKRALTEWEVE